MTPAPPWAVLCWADDRAVYVELPMSAGGFYRETFPLSESGLMRALTLLQSRKSEAPTPAPKSAARPSPFSDAQRARALTILRGRPHVA